MSVLLKKEKVPASEVICQKYSQTTIDCDVIVPDINPDIRRILDVSGFVKGNGSNLAHVFQGFP